MKTRAAVLREMGKDAPYTESHPLTIENFRTSRASIK